MEAVGQGAEAVPLGGARFTWALVWTSAVTSDRVSGGEASGVYDRGLREGRQAF